MKGLIVLLAIFTHQVGKSRSVIEKAGRVEFNWTTLKIRFFGEADGLKAGRGYPVLEKEAWSDGIQYIYQKLPEIRRKRRCWQFDLDDVHAKIAAEEVSMSTYSYMTTYFGSGGMRVHMESSLIKAFHPGKLDFGEMDEDDGSLEGVSYTGVVFEVAGEVSPCPVFSLYDETSGDLLFDVTSVSKISFDKGFMARWVRHPDSKELLRLAGSRPLVIPLVLNDSGKMVLSRKIWDEVLVGNEPLLSHSRVVFALR